jgi:hypothetical protein
MGALVDERFVEPRDDLISKLVVEQVGASLCIANIEEILSGLIGVIAQAWPYREG